MEYENKKVVIVSIHDEQIVVDQACDIGHSLEDILEFIADRPLKDQVCMMCNLLTINGFTQKEVSEAISMKYKDYRNRLWSNRKDYLKKAKEFFR